MCVVATARAPCGCPSAVNTGAVEVPLSTNALYSPDGGGAAGSSTPANRLEKVGYESYGDNGGGYDNVSDTGNHAGGSQLQAIRPPAGQYAEPLEGLTSPLDAEMYAEPMEDDAELDFRADVDSSQLAALRETRF